MIGYFLSRGQEYDNIQKTIINYLYIKMQIPEVNLKLVLK